jgi:hypothetical protein
MGHKDIHKEHVSMGNQTPKKHAKISRGIFYFKKKIK